MVDPSMSPSFAINDDADDPNSLTPSNNQTSPIQIIDEESSLSTATSLTSLITSNTPHTLRTGVDTAAPEIINERDETIGIPQQGRNRSMSVPNSVFLSPDGTSQMRSTSANRNRSNPRTRTPMRHASPLLVTGRLFSDRAVSDEGGEDGGRLREWRRSESIIEETGGETNNEGQNEPTSRPGRLLYAHARPSATQASVATQQTRPQRQLSTKQLPSHRKLRRWNNDRFINTHTSTNAVVHPVMVKEGEEYYHEYWMPNYPCEYRSEFARLVNDETKKGSVVRERFLKGEVGSSKVTEPSSILDQFQSLSDADIGRRLYRKLSPRIRSILTRCRERSSILESETTENQTSMTIQTITAFETYITSCVFQPKKHVDPSAGFPPLLSDDTYAIFNKIFSAPPNLVIKKSKRKASHGRAIIPCIHFYFDDESNGAESKRSGSFNRILLYAVCNFHGLIASSRALDGKNNSRSSGRDSEKGVKVVTVQSDAVLGIDLKLLDFVDCSS